MATKGELVALLEKVYMLIAPEDLDGKAIGAIWLARMKDSYIEANWPDPTVMIAAQIARAITPHAPRPTTHKGEVR